MRQDQSLLFRRHFVLFGAKFSQKLFTHRLNKIILKIKLRKNVSSVFLDNKWADVAKILQISKTDHSKSDQMIVMRLHINSFKPEKQIWATFDRRWALCRSAAASRRRRERDSSTATVCNSPGSHKKKIVLFRFMSYVNAERLVKHV